MHHRMGRVVENTFCLSCQTLYSQNYSIFDLISHYSLSHSCRTSKGLCFEFPKKKERKETVTFLFPKRANFILAPPILDREHNVVLRTPGK